MTQKRLNTYAFIGWAIQDKNFTKEQLDNMPDFDFIILMDEWERFKRRITK